MLQRHTRNPLSAVIVVTDKLPVCRRTHSWVCFLHCWPSSLCRWWWPPGHPAFLGGRHAVINGDPVKYKINQQHAQMRSWCTGSICWAFNLLSLHSLTLSNEWGWLSDLFITQTLRTVTSPSTKRTDSKWEQCVPFLFLVPLGRTMM